MELTNNWRGIYLVVLLQVLNFQGASLEKLEKRGEQPPETIVAVAGVSPALLDTAISLFDSSIGKNWNYGGNLNGGNKYFPFPMMMEPPQPLKPLLNPASRPKPQLQLPQIFQQSADEKDQSGGIAPLAPLTPLQPVETQEGIEPLPPLEPQISQHEVDTENLVEDDADNSPLFHPDAAPALDPIPELVSLEEIESSHAPADSETLSVPPYVPKPEPSTPTGWSPQGSNGWTQGSQGGHNTGGNQVLSMNLSGVDADVTTSNNVSMHVVSDGGSSSSTHFIGARGVHSPKPNHHHHQGQPQSNGAINYIIRFRNKE